MDPPFSIRCVEVPDEEASVGPYIHRAGSPTYAMVSYRPVGGELFHSSPRKFFF